MLFIFFFLQSAKKRFGNLGQIIHDGTTFEKKRCPNLDPMTVHTQVVKFDKFWFSEKKSFDEVVNVDTN